LTPCILVKIIDQGKGLSQEEADKVFMPFYRTDLARQQQVEGAGLGLAISHSIVELHRGTIWAEATSRKEPGGNSSSRFHFMTGELSPGDRHQPARTANVPAQFASAHPFPRTRLHPSMTTPTSKRSVLYNGDSHLHR
jgi:hypothetical protein